jgi:hypothetical protein
MFLLERTNGSNPLSSATCRPIIEVSVEQLVPLESMTEAATALRAAGVPVETLACVGTEHSIDQEGLVGGGHFLQQTLKASAR